MHSLNRDPQGSSLIRLRGVYPSLKTALQKVADLVLQQPEMVIYVSVNAVAAAAGVSEATVMRFCRTLGFKGFQDFKIALARELVTSPQYTPEEVGSDDGPVAIVRQVFQSGSAALQDTLQLLDAEAVQEAAQALLQARRALIVGLDDAAPLVSYAVNRFFLLGIDAHGYTDGYNLLTAVSLAGPEDVLLAISYLGGTREVVEAAQLARDAGATVIAVTNNSLAPLSRVSDLVLVTASGETSPQQGGMASFQCNAFVINCLFALMVQARPQQVQENNAKIDKVISNGNLNFRKAS
ncbi:MAG TPA: MurR/RpiR family transcriptional regulator [Desulfobaccales bacterium]